MSRSSSRRRQTGNQCTPFGALYYTTLFLMSVCILYLNITNYTRISRLNALIDSDSERSRKVIDYVYYDLKPRVTQMDRVLSFQLPTAIVKAFEISHTDLRETLESVVVDLAKLTELYRALLGFNDDWALDGNAQRLRCTWSPYSYSEELNMHVADAEETLAMMNQTLNQVQDMYGDYGGIKDQISNLFAQIKGYISQGLDSNQTHVPIQYDSYINITNNYLKAIRMLTDNDHLNNLKTCNARVKEYILSHIDNLITEVATNITYLQPLHSGSHNTHYPHRTPLHNLVQNQYFKSTLYEKIRLSTIGMDETRHEPIIPKEHNTTQSSPLFYTLSNLGSPKKITQAAKGKMSRFRRFVYMPMPKKYTLPLYSYMGYAHPKRVQINRNSNPQDNQPTRDKSGKGRSKHRKTKTPLNPDRDLSSCLFELMGCSVMDTQQYSVVFCPEKTTLESSRATCN